MQPLPILITAVSLVLGTAILGSVAYLCFLLLGAALARRSRADCTSNCSDRLGLKMAVVIPAHDEELVIEETLKSLGRQDYPQELLEVVVIADNCTDGTSAIGRRCGATVLERNEPSLRGKGYALEWALSRLLTDTDAEGYIIVDADTWVAPDFVAVMARRLIEQRDARGYCAIQGRYGVLNQDEGWRAALMTAAFDLHNHVRPLGAARWGFSVGLKGNGMAFSRPLLLAAPWQGRSITEDIDYGLDLLENHGVRVRYAGETRVLAQMPTTAAQASSQRARWEGGRYRLLRERFLPLVGLAIRGSSAAAAEAALSLAVPPLAELAVLLAVWSLLITIGLLSQTLLVPLVSVALAGTAVLGFGIYVLCGLRVAQAPAAAYRALMMAPFYAVWKLALYAGGWMRPRSGAASQEWVRTERARMASEAPSVASENQR